VLARNDVIRLANCALELQKLRVRRKLKLYGVVMRLKIFILISMMMICGAAVALQFNEKIVVEGGGDLFARTNTDAAKDQVNGTGHQNYTRNLDLQKSITSLKSEYHLKGNLSEGTNHYYAEMNSPYGLKHFISVYASSNIDSISTISQSDDKVSTDYNIQSNMATLSESITDSGDGKTRNDIAETQISGNFTIESKVVDDGTNRERPSGSSPEDMLEMLESADISGDTGHIDVTVSETEVFLVGTPVSVVRSVPSQNVTLPDGTTGNVIKGNNTIKQIFEDGTEGIPGKFGEVIYEDTGNVFIVGTVDGGEENSSESGSG